MKFCTCLLSIVYCLFFAACGNNSTKTSEIKLAGQSLYETNCTSCHGEDGKLCVLGAKDLSATTFSKDQVVEIITSGKGTMTPFQNVLNKEEIDSLADYVQTLKAK